VALVELAFSPEPVRRIFAKRFSEPGRNYTAEPYGQLCFNAELALTAIGAGDTEEAIITFVLDVGFVYKLRFFQVTVLEGAAGANNWMAEQLLAAVHNQPGLPELVHTFPIAMGETLEQGAGSAGIRTRSFFLAQSIHSGSSPPTDPITAPTADFRALLVYASGTQPTFGLMNTADASNGPWTCQVLAIFDQYNVSQEDNSALFWPTITH